MSPTASPPSSAAPSLRWWLPVVWLLLGVALTACQARFPSERVPRTEWLVLPLSQPPGSSDTPRAIQGWWLGARTIRQNPRAGEQVADLLNRRMAMLGYVNLYSPVDLRYYFADKRQALQNAYPHLDRGEIDDLLDQVPKNKYGRELGADRILTGRIVQLYMGENRTIHWWWSVADIEMQVIDVANDRVLWSKRYFERDQFSSQTSVLERVVERAIADLRREIFGPMALAP
jgi:hypothetical protein